MGRVGIGLVVVLVAAGWAWADVTVEQARAIAQECAGHTLDGFSESRLQGPDGRLTSVEFSAAGGARERYYIDGATGLVLFYRREREASPESGPAVDASRAREAAIAEARQRADGIATGMRWEVAPAESPGLWSVTGAQPPVGVPPREGLSARIEVEVGREGRVLAYGLHVPRAGPRPVFVSAEEAVALVRRAIARRGAVGGQPVRRLGLRVADAPTLVEDAERVAWHVPLANRAYLEAAAQRGASPEGQVVLIVRVDAQTGEIVGEAGAPDGSRNARGGARWAPIGLSAVAAVSLLLAALVRRRAARS